MSHACRSMMQALPDGSDLGSLVGGRTATAILQLQRKVVDAMLAAETMTVKLDF